MKYEYQLLNLVRPQELTRIEIQERRTAMSHIIAKAIIENGQLTYVDKELPHGKIKAHIIYDSTERKPILKNNFVRLLQETSGIYKNIDPKIESRVLREEWERNAEN
jgi:hypothetical protein